MKQIKNICITINSLQRGGAEKQCLLLAKALKSSYNLKLVILNSKPVYTPRIEFIKNEEIPHVFLPSNKIKRTIELYQFFKNEKIDLVLSFLPADIVWSSIFARLNGVSNIYGGLRNSHIPRHKFLALKLIHNSILNGTISNNHAAVKKAIEFGFKDKFVVIHNGIEIKENRVKQKAKKLDITVMSAGRLVKQKDYPTALRAIAQLKKDLLPRYSIRYKILGNGPELEFLKKQINALDIHKEVHIITDSDDIYQHLEKADIYLSTSLFEGLSNAIMEAMNCGVPIVATNVGDNEYLVQNDENGYLTDIKDSKGLASRLWSLIDSSEQRLKMGLKSHEKIDNGFGYETFKKNYLKFIENIQQTN